MYLLIFTSSDNYFPNLAKILKNIVFNYLVSVFLLLFLLRITYEHVKDLNDSHWGKISPLLNSSIKEAFYFSAIRSLKKFLQKSNRCVVFNKEVFPEIWTIISGRITNIAPEINKQYKGWTRVLQAHGRSFTHLYLYNNISEKDTQIEPNK